MKSAHKKGKQGGNKQKREIERKRKQKTATYEAEICGIK